MQTSVNANLRQHRDRKFRSLLAAALQLMIEGISSRAQAITGSPLNESLANQRSSNL